MLKLFIQCYIPNSHHAKVKKKKTGSQSLSSYGQFALLKSINTCIYPIHLYVTWIKIESSNQETKVSR